MKRLSRRGGWIPTDLTSKGLKWSEGLIGRTLARGLFKNKMVLLIRNCYWTGFETDLLGVTQCLRLVDVEIKISRSDLKADKHKDKWWYRPNWKAPKEPALWPRHVWKHYYCLPYDIWTDVLLADIPANSGVLLLVAGRHGEVSYIVRRAAKPNRDAKRLEAVDVINIARLANIRMWEALAKANPKGTQRPRIKVLP